jgi:hypothetical protein
MPFGEEARFEREVICEDCGATEVRWTREAWPRGPEPGICKRCQNARYLAGQSPERRRQRNQRKALLAKRRRLELKIQKAQADLQSVVAALDQNAQNGP